ncbi:MAG: ANTAR domain-containing protein [Lachnospiraceae bacterium]|nr:ANTAR domain-containing protein [Lachnospiraceae bacterium]
MSLSERVYSVLVVSSAEKLNNALSSLLAESNCDPVRFVTGISSAKRIWSEGNFDFIIINSPLPDDSGVRFAIDAAASKGTVVLLLLRPEVYDETREKVVEHGVFTLAKPLSRPVVQNALDWMESARERLKKMDLKTLSVEEKMEEIRTVNRAKWLLISQHGMDEPSAHRYIEKQAMDRCISKREVAEEIIRTYMT